MISLAWILLAPSSQAEVRRPANRAAALQLLESGLKANIITVPAVDHSSRERQCVVAGSLQFRSLWARDFSMAVPGLLKLGHVQPVRDTLELFFANARREDGLLPRLIDSMSYQQRVVLGLLGIRMPLEPDLKPSYVSENGVVSIDGNLLLISAAWNYARMTGDKEFARRYLESARKLLTWIMTNHIETQFDATDNELAPFAPPASILMRDQPPYSDWADSIDRSGSVAMTQVLLIRALRDLSQWEQSLELSETALRHRQFARAAVTGLYQNFWNASGYLMNTSTDSRLSADANWAAVAWGIVDGAHATAIVTALEQSQDLVQPIPGRALHGEYSPSEKSAYARAIGLSAYHDQDIWLWLTALAIQSYERIGRTDRAEAIRDTVAQLILEFNGVHEIYEDVPNPAPAHAALRPVVVFAYHAEFPFTWSSAMLADAMNRSSGDATPTAFDCLGNDCHR